jgi:adenylate cyclase
MIRGVSPYQIGGSLGLNASTYVVRQADQQLYESMRSGELCCVFNARQMGKSSLRVRLQRRLQDLGGRCAYIDMTRIGSEQVTPREWYRGIVVELLRSFQLFDEIDIQAWWQEHGDLSPVQQLSLFLEDVLLELIHDCDLYILVDEIDSALGLSFGVDDFFALIRSGYEQRTVNPAFNRLNWALFGVTKPGDLIRDRGRTPFNIGRSIDLQGFDLAESAPLMEGLMPQYPQPQKILQEILHWTNGQPFLTQKLCQLMRQRYPVESVAQMVQEQIVTHWESQDRPEHLRTIRDRLLRQETLTVRMLGIYQEVLMDHRISADDSQEQTELLLSGLVIVGDQGDLQVKNPIYRAVFNPEWLGSQLAQLRPYALPLKAWLADGHPQHLLVGEELKTMLAWAKEKRLSDLDYRFLSASQDREKQIVDQALIQEKSAREQASFALDLFQNASQRLGTARIMAQKMTARSPLDIRAALLVAAGVGLATIALRGTGLLQPLEWMMGDRFFQGRGPSPMSQVVTLVEINEADLRALGRYPITDGTLAQALKIIQQYQPRRIGLDLYRELPIEPGQQDLQQMMQVDNLIGIEKAVTPKIDPHPELAARQQIGFADQVIDSDGKVRRALLSIRDKQQTQYSLGLRLALDYLEQEKITPIGKGGGLRLGQGLIAPLASNDGSYIRAETGGYQIILNFYGTQRQFSTIPLRYILAQQFDPALLRDRIVLIGHTAESVNDLFQTPYSSNFGDRYMPGVVVHANIIEQLIGAAKGNHLLLRSLPEEAEWLWIMLCGALGCAIVRQLGRRSFLSNTLSVIGASLGVLGLGYGLFLAGWLLPVVPAILALLAGATILPALAQKQWERQELKQLLTLLITTGDEPEEDPVQRLAIELLKQSESSDQQSFIDAWVRQSRQ